MIICHSSSLARSIFRFGVFFLMLVFVLTGCENSQEEKNNSADPQKKVAVEKSKKKNLAEKIEKEPKKGANKESALETQEEMAMEIMEDALASEKFTPDRPMEEIMSDMFTDTFDGALEAAKTPVKDIGLIEDPIPEELLKYKKNAYALPEPMTCKEIHKQIVRLNELLGPDATAPDIQNGTPAEKNGEYITRGSEAAQDRVADTVTGYVNILPFRSVIRYMSGAEDHVREIEKAHRAGIARRSFLKGLANGHGCGPIPPPAKPATAAPAPPTPPAPLPEYRQRSVVKR